MLGLSASLEDTHWLQKMARKVVAAVLNNNKISVEGGDCGSVGGDGGYELIAGYEVIISLLN